MKSTPAISLLALLIWSILTAVSSAQFLRPERVRFAPGKDKTKVEGRIRGRETAFYSLSARRGQNLEIKLKSKNDNARFNVYLPGRRPGDDPLFASVVGGRTYKSPLYASGDYSISVSLDRAGAYRGEDAKFDLEIKLTGEPQPERPNRPGGPGFGQPGVGHEMAWARVRFVDRSHAPLVARQMRLPGELSRQPSALALGALAPDCFGTVTSLTTRYDRMEGPRSAEVTVTEGGIMDDDLLGIRHIISLSRLRNNQWRIMSWKTGELRRVHLR